MIHCANFWKWFVVPGLVFMLEKIIGIAVSRMGGLYIVEVNLLPSKVSNANAADTCCSASAIRVYSSDTCSLILTAYHCLNYRPDVISQHHGAYC